MISEVVICIAYADIKCNPTVKFSEIVFNSGAPFEDEIYYIQISISICITVSIRTSKHGHCRGKMYAIAFMCPVKSLSQQSVIFAPA